MLINNFHDIGSELCRLANKELGTKPWSDGRIFGADRVEAGTMILSMISLLLIKNDFYYYSDIKKFVERTDNYWNAKEKEITFEKGKELFNEFLELYNREMFDE